MLDKLLALLTPQAVKDRIVALEAEVAALTAWKAQVEAEWPQILEASNVTAG